MEKLKMQTANKADENFKKLAEMFPNAVTEAKDENGEVVRAIDKDVLMQEINTKVVDGKEERYQFTWPDKKKSVLLANTPINKTLRPIRDDETTPTGADSEGKPYCSSGSVNFDNTENLYIEGDNLEVLKLLQETYLGKIKMIYIDPPYNTGNDFVYNDKFGISSEEWNEVSGSYDEDGNQIVGKLEKNTENNGRFHTDWLNMIYPRLKLAKDLMTDDGIIFISIDDYEQENMKKLCDEVFGDSNFVAQLVWQRAFSPKNDAKYISNSHDYVIMYAKNIDDFKIGRLPRTEEANARYSNPDNDPRGVWMSSDLSVKTYNPATDYPITTPAGNIINPPSGRCWRTSKDAFDKLVKENRVYFGEDGTNTPRLKRFLSELKYDGMAPTSILMFKEVGHSQEGSQEVTKLLDVGAFDGPKPTRLLDRLITLANTDKDSIILDFFSGSATTAHSVMKKNVEDGGKRKYVMVQLPEESDKKSIAYKAGYKNICEIGKERIRRAAKKIAEENPEAKFDGGFRVLKCDSSNMKEVYYNPAEYEPSLFSSLEDNIKEDRTPEDLLFQVMLDLGILLSSKIQVRSEKVGMRNYSYFDVEDGYLIACFDKNIDEEVITAIAKQKPYYFVMRDSSMATDSVATNFEQIFAAYSPDTVRKVL